MMNLVLHEEIARKVKERDRLKTELSMALCELETTQVEAHNIEMRYLSECGDYEQHCYEAKVAYLRVKRKAQLIQKAKNQKQTISLSAIEKQLDEEMKQYVEKLRVHEKKLWEMRVWQNGRPLSKEEAAELRRLYRKIVKQVHPDMNPEAHEKELRLFEKAVIAYRNGDLNGLMTIDSLLKDGSEEKQDADELDARITQIRTSLQTVLERAKKVKTTNPYLLIAYLENEDKLATRIEELKQMTKEYEEARERIEKEEPVFFS